MKRPCQDDEVQHLRDEIRVRIDAAAKSVAELLQVAADLFIATTCREVAVVAGIDKVEVSPVPEMMTSEQAAEYLGLKAQTLALWRCTRRHAVPFVKVGRKVRYRRTDLEKFLRCHTEYGGDEGEFT